MASPDKKKGVDLAIVFGGPRKGAPKGDDMSKDDDDMSHDDDMDSEDDKGSDVPPDFEAAYKEYEQADDGEAKMKAFWEAVKACVDYSDSDEG